MSLGSYSQARGSRIRAASRKRLPIKAAGGSSRIASLEKNQPAAANRVVQIINNRGVRFIESPSGRVKEAGKNTGLYTETADMQT
ncbi:hypothetical protein D3C76_1300400 [compost metagenome]